MTRTRSASGIASEDWFFMHGGDGFWSAVDPENPHILYWESRYGNMYRHDRLSGENIPIKPRPRKGEETYKWNWNAPLVISHHRHTRLYTMANKLFRSEDRGNSWEVISGDLCSGTDRNSWPVIHPVGIENSVLSEAPVGLKSVKNVGGLLKSD